MKNFGYRLLKVSIKTALHLYFGKIQVRGLEQVPKKGPVLFLPNHQNALMDVLLIAVACNRKPFFLTRSDVFKITVFKRFFSFLLMIPIYRIRDGRATLRNNQAVFDHCADLFGQGNAIVMFPEANHNLKRRVRNLSKGFTRVLFNAMAKAPDRDIYMVPVGLNYRQAETFPDEATVYYGSPILANDFLKDNDIPGSVMAAKKVVSNALKTLTTHIEDEENYGAIVDALQKDGIDFIDPMAANAAQKNLDIHRKRSTVPKKSSKLMKWVFYLLNFPVLMLWRLWAKPKVWEIEFMSTLRFAFAMAVYPIYYTVLAGVAYLLFGLMGAVIWVLATFLFNLAYVKFYRGG
ncbi:lysophospholipid acyltransferase family protein [Pseudozobellia thermophila]|uniref:1-acyl-sn-glycerol-3-phosphate acyltransferase n=1 Tax=Pseudozobellia thermophila TaxID=192903 RepID=A0A1M6HT60_9FLAO|nr:lysophospholipid acyltransferase family protein [Pseudozobellia thermophila]SHJ25338.1 1-acyl-sn-glycerol-3-phosphate acyltransferase [Pseudozobellia thermophila]